MVADGITHCANDNRLHDHARNGGLLLHTVQVPDRATALHIERLILNHYQTIAPVSLRRDLLPQGGATECFGYGVARAYAGHTDTTGPATTTYIKASLQEVATALATMTGQPHPLAKP